MEETCSVILILMVVNWAIFHLCIPLHSRLYGKCTLNCYNNWVLPGQHICNLVIQLECWLWLGEIEKKEHGDIIFMVNGAKMYVSEYLHVNFIKKKTVKDWWNCNHNDNLMGYNLSKYRGGVLYVDFNWLLSNQKVWWYLI